MDPLRIAIRVVFVYFVMLVLIRLSGKRTLRNGTALDFTIALIVGDMVDDVIWAEVAAAQFVVGVGTLFLVHTVLDLMRYRAAPGR